MSSQAASGQGDLLICGTTVPHGSAPEHLLGTWLCQDWNPNPDVPHLALQLGIHIRGQEGSPGHPQAAAAIRVMILALSTPADEGSMETAS